MDGSGSARRLPSGEVAFVLTDIEGSTDLFRRLGGDFPALLDRHRAIVREAVAAHGGAEVSTSGDGFLLAFADPADAVRCCCAAQRALREEPWPRGAELRVRMGVHVGEAEPVDGDYIALPVNQAARVMAAAHGGQVLVSDHVRRAAAPALGDDVMLVELGAFRLRDFDGALRLAQAVAPGLEPRFPAPRAPAEAQHNLLTQQTTFIGREEELGQVTALLRDHRLVTVLGPGGVGKTRLALEAAGGLVGDAPDGIWLVALGPLLEGGLVAPAVADVLGVPEADGEQLLDALARAMAPRAPLLVLDNCEHLAADAARVVDRLLSAAPQLRVLATSRVPLRVPGEVVWTAPPLSPPDARRLFAERALAAGRLRPGEDEAAIARLCERLDGIPLAIELAAARTRAMHVTDLLERMDDRFALLTTGPQTAPDRQQTLRNLVDWSHDLLTETEQVLFRRMSVFAGGATAAMAERVCAGDLLPRAAVIPTLLALVDHSLITVGRGAGGEDRYGMLETLRVYAAERLERAREAASAREHHLEAMAAFAEEAETGLTGPEQELWFARADEEQPNVAEALRWRLRGVDAEWARLRIAAGLGPWWLLRGVSSSRAELRRTLLEGRGLDQRLEREVAITLAATEPGPEALELALRDAGEAPSRRAAYGLALLCPKHLERGELDAARAVLERAEAMARELDDPYTTCLVGLQRAGLAWNEGDADEGERLYGELIAYASSTRNLRGYAHARGQRGELRLSRGDLEGAEDDLRAALRVDEQLRANLARPFDLALLGLVAQRRGDHERAAELLAEALELNHSIDDHYYEATAALGLSREALRTGRPDDAAQLLGAALHLRGPDTISTDAWCFADAAELERELRGALGEEPFESAVATGVALTDPELVELGRAVSRPPAPRAAH